MFFTVFYSVCGANVSEPPICVNVFLNNFLPFFCRAIRIFSSAKEQPKYQTVLPHFWELPASRGIPGEVQVA